MDQKVTTLRECFKEFLAVENLEGNNKWYCPTCKDHVQATKKFDLYRLPRILVIHLKRFQQAGYRIRSKISAQVDFPWRHDDLLDLTDLCQSPLARYRLFAICNHFGTLSGGHYTARAKSLVDGKYVWHKYDDSHVTLLGREDQLNEDELVNPSAYVLFYEQA
ncbi:ubiquitin carboxyl-terminal hydrolase [Gregarina niphandrodes]|uniref:ubiquitinyl hydrolase 1 n=1 Tax=Gregarina niphandrodes TaxID=110365 RepID=A0A023B1I6_GRENI|nr:ubiquitin carboxyl-terminal hydrolase [Gregarina niphandrodes]EZG47689.1 ubiquitin carboxyl-terminal hydrolase [Gregarina niphandrodes]|eukprot:XP_011132142.1 ubiquitin carboxyl-terminal hydrolase [Gregarina niphandrodes]